MSSVICLIFLVSSVRQVLFEFDGRVCFTVSLAGERQCGVLLKSMSSEP